MMIELNKKKWKEFYFPEIFEIKGGFYNKKPLADNEGRIPFIGATDSNNGITQFNTYNNIEKTSKTGDINNASIDKKIFKENCIVVTNNGSVGYAYYQKYNFTCSHDVNPLYLRNRELNEDIAKFLIAAIEEQRVCFTYIRKWRPKRMKVSKLMLPVDNNGKPDYDYMESYIKSLKFYKEDNYLNYAIESLEKLGDIKKIDELSEKKWKEFFITDFFDLPKRGKRIISKNYIEGEIPVVSSAGGNNGVTAFIGNTKGVRIYENCLSVANGGVSAGYAYYHPYKFIATDHITHFKGSTLNSYHYLFFSTIIKKQMQKKYGFSREITDKRLKREKLFVPVNNDGNPDYDYMEQYMKNLMIKKYSNYIEYAKLKKSY
ncbi:restriction endonuclease subunit S [Listeria monocytogenes]|nr:restriction endonuclease subunit S [Listeria monocytogenes]EAC8328487.1 restriction endonuclease subunit S [Listeria monocytogenes]EAC8635967.1 restriction endonuclease subunit S [Listeria monocytogenes]